MARNVFHDTILYSKNTNLNVSINIVGFNVVNAGKVFKVKYWDPLFVGWLEWNTDPCRITATHTTKINYVGRDNSGCSQFTYGKMIDYYSVFVV